MFDWIFGESVQEVPQWFQQHQSLQSTSSRVLWQRIDTLESEVRQLKAALAELRRTDQTDEQ